jgi:hypothetical protein
MRACDATIALITGRQPPVPVTRRVSPRGQTAEVDLAATPFWAGGPAALWGSFTTPTLITAVATKKDGDTLGDAAIRSVTGKVQPCP